MFSKEKRLLIAVSGGKDSLVVWQVLNEMGYNTTGYHINIGLGIYSEVSENISKAFAKRLNRPLYVDYFEKEVGVSLREAAKISKKPYCSVCGMVKRYLINRKGTKFDTLVTGHNLSDESATLFGNILHWNTGYMGRQFPVLEDIGSLSRKAKPLIYLTEREIAAYAFFKEIDYALLRCPNARTTTGSFYKNILLEIEEAMPATRMNFLKAYFLKIQEKFREDVKLSPCKKCGYLTSQDICSFCRLKEKIKEGKK